MPELSTVFSYISHFRQAGHQVGRKVGDMLEVLTYSYLATEETLEARIHLEPKLEGFSGAGHKVEFAISKSEHRSKTGGAVVRSGGEIKQLEQYLGFIECKKVGVEQTVSSSFKKAFKSAGRQRFIVPFGATIRVVFAPRGGVRSEFLVTFVKEHGTVAVDVQGPANKVQRDPIGADHRLIFASSTVDGATYLSNDRSLRDLKGILTDARILEVFGTTAEGVICTLNTCLAGPQTPEKAKQASFVALDARKKRLGSFDKRANETDFVSILILTETSHWEAKSLRMVESCVDFTLSVPDHIIVTAFKAFENSFGKSFYDRVSKETYRNDLEVSELVDHIVQGHRKGMFLDVLDHKYKTVVVQDNGLHVTDV